MLCPGQVYETSVTVHDLNSAPSAATLTITKPDGSTEAPYHPAGWTQSGRDYTASYDYTLGAPGLYSFAWVTQGPGTAPTPDFVNVRQYAAMVSRAEVKQHLNITTTTDDDELDSFIMASTELVETKVGICVPRQFTDRVEQGSWRLLLENKPVISVTSVTSVWPGGPSWQASQLRWDSAAAIVDQLTPFPFWWPPWDVVYMCGRQVIAERFILAAKEQCRHLWETQRGAMPPALLQGEEVFTTTTGFTFSVPRRVLELLEADTVPSS